MSQSQPDIVLYRPGVWRMQHPGPADISLMVEISDSSLSFGLNQKLALYKASGIQEYWVIDLKAKQLHRFVAPQYRSQTYGSGTVGPAAWPDVRIDVGELLA
jgi:Uma2 family endonuclease